MCNEEHEDVGVIGLTPYSTDDFPDTNPFFEVAIHVPGLFGCSREEALIEVFEALTTQIKQHGGVDLLWYASGGSGAYFLAQMMTESYASGWRAHVKAPILGFSDANYHQLGLLAVTKQPSYYCYNFCDGLSEEYLHSVHAAVTEEHPCFIYQAATDWVQLSGGYANDIFREEGELFYVISGNIQIMSHMLQDPKFLSCFNNVGTAGSHTDLLLCVEVSNANMQVGDFYRIEIALDQMVTAVHKQSPRKVGILVTEMCYNVNPTNPFMLHQVLRQLGERRKDDLLFIGIMDKMGHNIAAAKMESPILPIGVDCLLTLSKKGNALTLQKASKGDNQ